MPTPSELLQQFQSLTGQMKELWQREQELSRQYYDLLGKRRLVEYEIVGWHPGDTASDPSGREYSIVSVEFLSSWPHEDKAPTVWRLIVKWRRKDGNWTDAWKRLDPEDTQLRRTTTSAIPDQQSG